MWLLIHALKLGLVKLVPVSKTDPSQQQVADMEIGMSSTNVHPKVGN